MVAAADPFAVPRPADDGIKDRADFAPDRRIARQRQGAPRHAPDSRLRAQERDFGARSAMRQRDLIHRTIPSMAAAEINASLTPGAQAISGLPRLRPSPLRKSLTYPPASLTSRIPARQSHALM